MKKMFFRIHFITSLYLVLAMIFTLSGGVVSTTAHAAALTNKKDTMSSLKAGALSNHEIMFVTPTGLTAGQTITLTLASFSIPAGLDFEDIDFSTQATPDGVCTTGDTQRTLGSSASGSTWGAVRTSGTVITITSGTDTITAGAEVCIKIGTNATVGATGAEQITNPSAGSYTVAIAGTMADAGNIAVQILSDDQVSVSASVAESITFTISDNTIGFGTLSASGARYATGDTNGSGTETEAHTIVVGTNAANGYTVLLNGSTLTYGPHTIDAIGASNTASSPGDEQFGVRMTASGGSGTVLAPYAASGFAFDTAAFPDQVASATGASANTTYSVRYLANIASQTEAGIYTATLNYVATANF